MSKTVIIELPEDAVADIERARAATGEAFSDFVATAAKERATALAENSFFARKSKPFDRAGFLALLNREGGAPPDADDQAPGGAQD